VLTVAKVTQGAAGGYAEYLEGKAQAPQLGDYYLKDGDRVEAPGRWVGGAGAVGAHPELPVTGEQLRSLMAVRRPDTGEPLRRAGGSGEAVAALDATFSAPKSVSAIWAVGDRELRAQIERAHEQAIDRALAYSVERVAMIRQRVDQETVIHVKPAGVIATSWRHTTARAVADQPPDPQLHSHVLLHGAVRRDGQIVAIDSRSWLVHRREVGAAYRTELAYELNHLGFEIQRGAGRGQRYFEIAGIPAALVDRWSSRAPPSPSRDPATTHRPGNRAPGDHRRRWTRQSGRHRTPRAAQAQRAARAGRRTLDVDLHPLGEESPDPRRPRRAVARNRLRASARTGRAGTAPRSSAGCYRPAARSCSRG
jgi:conjugative relaxase-like TrwC/TraI family protein